MEIMKLIREFLKDFLQYHRQDNSMNFSERFPDKVSDDKIAECSLDYRGILIIYFYLVSKKRLSESEAEYLGEILKLTESNDKLALLLNEIDEITYQDLDYFELESLYNFENQRSLVMELIVNQTDYKALLVGYYSLVMRPTISDLEAEYLEKILDQAQLDPKLALLLNEIDELSYKKLGFTERDFAEIAAQIEQSQQIPVNIITEPTSSNEISQDNLASAHIPAQFSPEETIQIYCKQYIDRVIQVSQPLTRSKSTWFFIFGSVCSLALIRCNFARNIPQFMMPLSSSPIAAISPKSTASMSLSAIVKPQSSDISSTVNKHAQQTVQLRKKENNQSKGYARAATIKSWNEPGLKPLEASNRVESIAPDSHVGLLSPIKSSAPETEDTLKVTSAPNSSISVLGSQPPTAPADLYSSCCETIKLADQPRENLSISEVQWINKADPLLGTEWVAQNDLLRYSQLLSELHTSAIQINDRNTTSDYQPYVLGQDPSSIDLQQLYVSEFREIKF